MNEPGFYQFQPHHHHHHHQQLDPSAQEFFPSLPALPQQIYHPYPPHPTLRCSPAYFSADPSPPVPLYLPRPCSKPSRALVLSLVPADVSESMLRNELEVYGDVRAVHMEKLRRDGIVTVHFYDLRHAQTALVEIQEQHMQHQFRLKMHYDAVFFNNHNNLNNSLASLLPPPLPPPARGLIRGRVVWAQFTLPVTHDIPGGYNQGTLVIFNLDPLVSASSVQQIFEAFGPVKELRHTPKRNHQRFVEFYDTRNAAKALEEMDGKEINGNRITIEFSRPGGHRRRFSPPQPPPLQRDMLAKRSCFAKSPGRTDGNDKYDSSGGGWVQQSITSLCISAKEYEGSCKKSIKKYCNNNSNGGCGGASFKQQQQQHHKARSNRLWKGSRQVKEYDPLLVINEDAITESADCKDSRTTVMIRNIPNKYSLKLLLNLLDNHCISANEQISNGDEGSGNGNGNDNDDHQPLSSYDFVYLPIDFINKCNVGYAFVNMTSPEASWRLYKAFHLRSWEVFKSKKICEVTYARLQGVEAMREQFKNSKFPCAEEDYMPVVFSPPRNGRLQTEPLPIVGGPRNHPPPPPLLSSSSAVSSNQDQSEASSDLNNGDDNTDGQDLPEERVEVNEASEHNDDGVSGG